MAVGATPVNHRVGRVIMVVILREQQVEFAIAVQVPPMNRLDAPFG